MSTWDDPIVREALKDAGIFMEARRWLEGDPDCTCTDGWNPACFEHGVTG